MSNPQLDPDVFEQIVAEVIRRLLQQGVHIDKTTAAAAPTTNLEIEDRLVTLATLRNRLNGISQLSVARRAIVTPAVIDDLKDRGIMLQRRTEK